MSKKKDDVYIHVLNQALKNYHSSEWLGENCPLASLYFAGDWIDVENSHLTAKKKGIGLQRMIQAAFHSLWGGELPVTATLLNEVAQEEFLQKGHISPKYQHLLLELRYFRSLFPPSNYPQTTKDFHEFLGISRSQFFVHLNHAVEFLGETLLKLSQPAFRLENPNHQSDAIGRDKLLDNLSDGLKKGESAAISGVSGIGKTALGKLTMQAWDKERVFWYTIRPRITDHVESLIYALGSFLHTRSEHQSTLWKQLMSNPDQAISTDICIGLLRNDVEQFDHPLLLCFDEVDLLQTDVTSERGLEHKAFLFFLESLCDAMPILLIGQHIPVDTKQHVALTPLRSEQTHAFITAKTSSLSDTDIETLHTASRGVPRLIELALALHQTGESIDDVVASLANSASVHAIMGRLWNRLDINEQETLGLLSVLQGAVAAALLPLTYQQTLLTLAQRTLINTDANGGTLLDALIQRLVYRQISRELRDHVHLIAADIRYTLGEYTSSAYHYAQAEEYDSAIAIWFPHRNLEIGRGRTKQAQDIFLNIPSRHLSKKQHKQLQAIRNQLHLLTGDMKRIIEETTAFYKKDVDDENEFDEVNVEIHNQLGEAYMVADNLSASQKQYEQNLAKLVEIMTSISKTIYLLVPLHNRTGMFEEIRQQLKSSDVYSNYAHGRLEFATSNFRESTVYFEQALTLAESLGDQTMMANIEWEIASNATYNNDIEKAITYYERSATKLSNMDDIVGVNKIDVALGFAYLSFKKYTECIEKLEPTLDFFRGINDTYTISIISYNLAEAYFYSGEIDLARSSALKVMQLEYPYKQPYALRVLGLVEGKKGHIDSALNILTEGIQHAQNNEDRYIEAAILYAIGDVYRDSDYLQANKHYQLAIALFNEMGLTNEAKEIEMVLLPSTKLVIS